MIEFLQGEERLYLVGVEETPIKGSTDRYFVHVAWLRRSVWQGSILLDDGRRALLPEEIRNKPSSQTFKNAEFVIKRAA